MPQDFLTALVGACLLAALSYTTNQLPGLRPFRGSGVLLVLLFLELTLLAWVWQTIADKGDLYQAHQALFDNGKLILLGALAVNLLLLLVGLLRQEPDSASTIQPNLRDRLLQAELEEVEKRQADALHNQILIDLGMTDEREQVGRPAKQLITTGSTVDLPAATQMIEVFRRREVGGRLLILGNPGAGKTTMLLELAKALLEAGQQDPNAPVPVILELSNWQPDPKQKTLADWLVEQLWQKYKLARETSRDWLASGQILPLLDGLDELGLERQQQVMRVIDRYLEADAKLDLVVCCRWEEYQESQSQIIQLNGAVRLQPLTDAQIQTYLNQFGKSDFWPQIAVDVELLALCRIPLLLHFMVIVYRGQSIRSQQDLFDAYILRRFELRLRKQVYPIRKEPSQQQTRQYLVWLAQRMQTENETEFLIERLQPVWLATRQQKWLYGLLIGLMTGIIGCLISELSFGSMRASLYGLLLGLIWGGLIESSYINPIEVIGITWSGIIGIWIVALISLLTTILLSIRIDIIITLLFTPMVLGLVCGMIIRLVNDTKKSLKYRTISNQGIKESAKIAISITTMSIFIFSFFVLWLYYFSQDIGIKIYESERLFISQLGICLLMGFACGGFACVQHLALRIVLWNSKLAPWNYAKFLSYAAERRFIQQVGGRYRFIHRLLRDHFAAMGKTG